MMKRALFILAAILAANAQAVTASTKFGDVPASKTLGTLATELGIALDNYMDENIISNVSSAVVSNLVPSWAMATNPPQSGTDGEAVTNIVAGMGVAMTNNLATKAEVGEKRDLTDNTCRKTESLWVASNTPNGLTITGQPVFHDYGSDSVWTWRLSDGDWDAGGTAESTSLRFQAVSTSSPYFEACAQFDATIKSYCVSNEYQVTETFVNTSVASGVAAATNGMARAAEVTAAITAATTGQTATNLVRSIAGTIYDEPLVVLWEQRMVNGNLYYIAVTNVNLNAE